MPVPPAIAPFFRSTRPHHAALSARPGLAPMLWPVSSLARPLAMALLLAAIALAPAPARASEHAVEFESQIFRLLHLPSQARAADAQGPDRPTREANLTGLFVAMASGDLSRVRRLTPPRELLDAVDRSSGASPLTWAAQLGDVRMVVWLVSRGASVRGLDGLGATPLVCAARYGHVDVTRALLDYGADPNQPTDLGLTPLLAACGPEGSLETVRLLRSRGAALDSPGASGWTALATAVKAGHEDIVQELLLAGARPGGDPAADYSPLHWAVTENYLTLARLLIRHGADANAEGQRGIRPLDWCRSEDMRTLLVRAGARPTVRK